MENNEKNVLIFSPSKSFVRDMGDILGSVHAREDSNGLFDEV